jgi:hypothetical protein
MEYLELWGILATVFIFFLYYLIGRCYGKVYILKRMLYAEKNASELGIYGEKQKFQYILNQYENLPGLVKIVISEDIYEGLVLQFDDETCMAGKPPIDK